LAQPDAGQKQELEYLKQEKWGASQEQKTFKGLAAQRSGETAYGYRSEYTARATASNTPSGERGVTGFPLARE
jgi:hypothetical protein